MFSLYRNYVLEQNKLITDLQDKLVKQNIKLNSLEVNLSNINTLIPYFKKIAQLLSQYCVDNVDNNMCITKSPMGADLILLILDYTNTNNDKIITEKDIKNIEQKIDIWEQEIIRRKDSIPKTLTTIKEKEINSPAKSSENLEQPTKDKKVIEKFSGLLLVERDN